MNVNEKMLEIMNDISTRPQLYDIKFKLNYLEAKLLLEGYNESEVQQAITWAALKWA